MTRKTKLFTVALSLALVLSILSVQIYAETNEHYETEPAEYLQYDYASKTITTYQPSSYASSDQTWDLFSPMETNQMRAALLDSANVQSMNDNVASPADIIGEDTRYFTPPSGVPYSSVAFIRRHYRKTVDGVQVGYFSAGTGFLVSDKVLLTAAHCIVPDEEPAGYELLEIRIYFDLDITAPDYQNSSLSGYSYIHPQRWTWSTNWHNEEINERYDYCVIELTQAVDRPYYFNCVQSSNTTNQSVYVSGYPTDHKIHQMTSYGQLSYADYYVCRYNNDTVNMMSGSPVYNTNCVAIHVRGPDTGYNEGILFTPYLYNLICSKISDNQ